MLLWTQENIKTTAGYLKHFCNYDKVYLAFIQNNLYIGQ